MSGVYPSSLQRAWPYLARAVSLHVGAAAASAALRTDLVEHQFVTEDEFNRCFAVARLTPGTNLVALYAALGYRIRSWAGALSGIMIGTGVPGLMVTVASVLYVRYGADPLVARFMGGAKAAAAAVLAWGVVRLSWPVLRRHRMRGAAIITVTLLLALFSGLSPFIILLLAGGVGGLLLSARS